MSTVSSVLLTGGPGFFSRLASVRLLAAARAVRGMEESRMRVPTETELDHDAERLDAVAGSEFVDDRIRLRE